MKKILKLIICPKRINRLSFILRILLWCLTVYLAIIGTKLSSELLGIIFVEVSKWIVVVGFICITFGVLSAVISRLHDCNMSAYYLLLIFIPFGLLAVIIWTFFCRGTHGSNKFGDEPKCTPTARIDVKNSIVAQKI